MARRVPRAAALAWLVALLASPSAVAAGPDPPPAPLPAPFPAEWHAARVDPASGGRFLPGPADALAEFQRRALESGEPLPFPHYAPPGSVAMALNAASLEGGAGRRLATLLAFEAEDPELRVLAFTDADPDRIIRRLGLAAAAASGQLVLLPVRQRGTRHPTFPFLRDYAPLVRVLAGPSGLRTAGLVLFRQPILNKVLDPERGTVLRRRASTVRHKAALTRRLAEAYRARLPHPVPVQELGIVLDGGNLLSDGRGTCFATDVLLAQNGGDEARVRKRLREGAGCARVVFLAAPRRLDDVQHVDTLLYFADPSNAVLSMPALYPSDFGAERRNLQVLLALGYRVHRVPRRTASISYANLLTTRRHAYVPQYTRYAVEAGGAGPGGRPRVSVVEGDPELERDNRHALRVLGKLLPGRRVVPVDSDDMLLALGSWHCVSHELPEALAGL